jgi:hypothetical protein
LYQVTRYVPLQTMAHDEDSGNIEERISLYSLPNEVAILPLLRLDSGCQMMKMNALFR